jgi:hypothetical protein
MVYERTKHLKPAEFKRFWGVTYETFDLHGGNSPSTQSTKKENWTTWEN